MSILHSLGVALSELPKEESHLASPTAPALKGVLYGPDLAASTQDLQRDVVATVTSWLLPCCPAEGLAV